MSFIFYEVGGKVRDEILGLQSKDIDYVAVPNLTLIEKYTEAKDMFNVLVEYLKAEKFTLFLITEDCYTVRAKYPKGHKHEGLVADFVMARKEIGYVPGTRTPIVVPGTLYDDLQRRDFTLNALAKSDDGNIIDYFDGLNHLKQGILRTPLPCKQTFDDDPLRILRAIRFSITKGFIIPDDIWEVMFDYDYENKMCVVSVDRIREELSKCFKHNTLGTLMKLNEYPYLRNYIFNENKIWLKPTNEQ
jgi:tRNA nucleotidyltransferase/poly(A) polymerase